MAADSTTSAQRRRVTKPLMEKRRRARINVCLAQLKDIVMKASNTSEGRGSRLEKADILEMTVQYVRQVHKLKNTTEDVSGDKCFRAGYQKCISEVSAFLMPTTTYSNEDERLQRSLLHHLQQKVPQNQCYPCSDPIINTSTSPHGHVLNFGQDSDISHMEKNNYVASNRCAAISVIVDPSSRRRSPNSQSPIKVIQSMDAVERNRSTHRNNGIVKCDDMWRPW